MYIYAIYIHVYFQYFSSDSAIKEFIKYVDEKQLLGKRFIIHDLDEVHLFISSDVPQHLQVRCHMIYGHVMYVCS